MLGDDYDPRACRRASPLQKDAPSGTALALGQSAAHALGRDLGKAVVNGRKGILGERSKKEVALLSVRAGDIVGEHTVIFGAIGECLELIHRRTAVIPSRKARCALQNGWQRKSQGFTICGMFWGFNCYLWLHAPQIFRN